MKSNKYVLKTLALYLAVLAPFIFAGTALAAEPAGVNAVKTFIDTLIRIASLIAGSVAIFFVIVGGYRYVTSTNNPEKLEGAKGTLIHAGVGLAIIIAANVIISIITEAATSAFGK